MARKEIRKLFSFVIIIVFLLGVAFNIAAYDPPQGGNDINRLHSPEFVSGAASVTSIESPQADAVNPAASGGQQRTTLDVNYGLITDFQSQTEFGHAVNIGATVPSKYGVFTGTLHFLTTDYTDTLNFGTSGGFNFSFAKDLFPNFYVGAGLGFTIGSFTNLDWGLWLDLGVLYLPGTVGFLKDFRLGVALWGLGKWYDPITGTLVNAFPSPFTPAVGLGFNLVHTDSVQWGFTTDLSFPTFQDIKFDIASELLFREFVGFRTAFSLDVRELVDARNNPGQPAKSFIPSFGLYFNFKTKPAEKAAGSEEPGLLEKQGWDRSDIKTQAAALPLYSNRWALSLGVNIPLGVVDRSPPAVAEEYPTVLYLSPNNDGKNDDLLLPITIKDERYIKGYSLVIQDKDGNVVRTIVNKDERPENVTVKNLLNRLAYVKQGIQVPETLRWDGYGDDGAIVPDGEYAFLIKAYDDNGNQAVSPASTIHVDMTVPEILVTPPENQVDLIFSPDKDGNKDTLLIRVSGSVEDNWEGIIKDAAGETVKTFSLDNQAPKDLTWDGRNDEDILLPDGVYHFTMATTDRAKNDASAELTNIIINTQRPEISLTIDNKYFSPNGDGVKDQVKISQFVPLKTGILSWELKVTDESGAIRREYGVTTREPVPPVISFDGNDDAGTRLPEGSYKAALTMLYENGYNPSAETPVFWIDVTKPTGMVKADYAVFSPNGDGNKDSVSFAQDSSQEDVWEGVILDGKGDPVKQYYWPGRVDATVSWDGRREDKTPAPDDVYKYIIYATDRAGNRGDSPPASVELSTLATPVAIVSGYEAFSPNGDGVKETIPLKPNLTVTDGVERYSITVVDKDGNAVRSLRGRGAPDTDYVWDGLTDNGLKAPDGSYHVLMDVVYVSGNNPNARTPDFSLDRVTPRISIDPDFPIISPNGDGNQDQLTVSVTDVSEEDAWTGTVKDSSGNTVTDYTWVGKPDTAIVWEGKGRDGRIVPDGTYSFELTSTDKAGNTGKSRVVTVAIDTKETPVLLTAERDAFSPNGDGVKDTMPIIPQLKVSTGIRSYVLSINNAAGTELRQFTGADRVDDVFTWNGQSQAGAKVPDGLYTAEISVTYVNGNKSNAKTQPFVLDTVAPVAVASADLAIFSPNNDGRKDAVVFTQQGSVEQIWVGKVLGQENKAIKTYNWKNKPEATLTWDGFGDSGGLAPDGVYGYQLESTDQAGNTGRSEPVSLELVTVETPLLLTADLEAFSPNGDGKKDGLTFSPQLGVTKGVDNYSLRVMSANGAVIRNFAGAGVPPATIAWDGTTDGKTRAPEGSYTAVLTLQYVQGNQPETNTGAVTLDTVFPEISISSDYTLFSPNGDGKKDSVAFTQRSSKEDLWEGFIRDSKGGEVRKYLWKNSVESFSWDGTDASGNKVKDDAYTYTVQAVDAAGNETRKNLGPIQSDTRYTSAFITANKTGFAPKGSGADSTISFTLYSALRDGISTWSVSMVDAAGRTQKRFSGTGTVPGTVSWDGRNESGVVTESVYIAQFRIIYAKGDEPEAKTPPFMVDLSPPDVRVGLNPVPFSPDNDGVDDDLSISLNLNDPSGIRDWTFAITDPTGTPFISFNGRGKPADRILWNGISGTGELVQAAEDYPYTLTVADTLGNTAVSKGMVPVDVLVIRDGDRLKIRISSINFEPYKANLILDNSDTGQKNQRILGRLAEILNKYRSYKIRIEGHAVSEYWDNPVRAAQEEKLELQPLSKSRADSVRDYLVRLGIDSSRLSTAGLGGTQPVVPHGDLQNRWKSRRVEFILIKP